MDMKQPTQKQLYKESPMYKYGRVETLQIGSWNIHGMLALNRRKLVDQRFCNLIKSLDICILLETWLSPDQNVDDFEIDGYYIYHKRCKHTDAGRGSGGISVLINTNIRKGVKIIDDSNNYCIWIKLDKTIFNCDRDIFIGACYIPPDHFSHRGIEIFDYIDESLSKYKVKVM